MCFLFSVTIVVFIPVVLPNVDVNSAVYQHLRYLVVAVGDGQVHSGQSVVLLSLHSSVSNVHR